MAKANSLDKNKAMVGKWSFLIGVLAAIIFGILVLFVPSLEQYMGILTFILIIIGLVVGFLNVTSAETMPFLMSGAVLIIASGLGQQGISAIPLAESILKNLLSIFVPATIIVAIKNVWSLAQD